MSFLGAVWENVYGLLVDDGWLAIGTLLALVVTGLWAGLTGGSSSQPPDGGGVLLFVLLMGLLLANLYAAGRNAARKRLDL